MGLRALEPERIARLRAAHTTQITLAERILDFANNFLTGARISAAEGNEVVVVLVAYYVKILADLWAIIVLAERGLPTSSLTRELLEALISIAYIAKEDSAARARLCVDYLHRRLEGHASAVERSRLAGYRNNRAACDNRGRHRGSRHPTWCRSRRADEAVAWYMGRVLVGGHGSASGNPRGHLQPCLSSGITRGTRARCWVLYPFSGGAAHRTQHP